MKVEQARMNLLQKARARPDQVRKVLETAKTLGWRSGPRWWATTSWGDFSIRRMGALGLGVVLTIDTAAPTRRP